jgi:hypothetical protein
MRGTIRLGTWCRFTATQVLAPPDGYTWAATARFLGLPVVGYDVPGGRPDPGERDVGLQHRPYRALAFDDPCVVPRRALLDEQALDAPVRGVARAPSSR